MKKVLMVGLDPDKVNYSDPALPPGMNAEKIHAGIKFALDDRLGVAGKPKSATSTPTKPPSRRLRASLQASATTA
jgi:hypothetical protein